LHDLVDVPFVSEEAMKLCASPASIKAGKEFFEKRQPSVVIARDGFVMADLEGLQICLCDLTLI